MLPTLDAAKHSSKKPDLTGYAVWAYRGGRWGLSEDRSEPGFESGGAPEEAGEYEGEVVRVLSVLSCR